MHQHRPTYRQAAATNGRTTGSRPDPGAAARGSPVRRAGRAGRRLALSGSLAIGGILGAISVALAHPLVQESSATGGGDLLPAFVPLLTAAAGVERVVEIGWNYLEWLLLRFARWRSQDLKTAHYAQFKSGTSMLAAIALGIGVVWVTDMRLLAYMQPTVPGLLDRVAPLWDMLFTGLVIGVGAKPAHDILGLLTRFKSFMGNVSMRQREEAGVAVADYVVRLSATDSRLAAGGMSAAPRAPGLPAGREESRDAQHYIDLVNRHLDDRYG